MRPVGEPVDDRGREPAVGNTEPHSENGRLLGDRDRGPFVALGDDLEEEFRTARVEVDVAELVEAEQVQARVAGDGPGAGRSSAASASSLTSPAAVT